MSLGSDSTFIAITYVFSAALFVSALVVAILTVRTRKEVKTKHSRDMKILATWESAVEGLYSGSEADVVVALDKIWALSSPFTYAEVQPILTVFANHPSKNVSMRARQILDKHEASLAQSSQPVVKAEYVG
jgi:hypothetical protein